MKALWNRLSVGGRLCLAVIAAYFLCAFCGGARSMRARLADETPAYNVVDVNARYQPPSAAHWMGTDNLGRDVSARLVQGAWISFQVGIGTSLIAIPLGVLLGLLGGYFGGKTDSLFSSSSRSLSSRGRGSSASCSASASPRGWACAARSARR